MHLRNWPLVIKGLISDYDDPAISLGLRLHEIVERMTAQEFFQYEIDLLEDKISQYLDLRKSVKDEFPNIFPHAKPKHHFIRKDTLLIYFLISKNCIIIKKQTN